MALKYLLGFILALVFFFLLYIPAMWLLAYLYEKNKKIKDEIYDLFEDKLDAKITLKGREIIFLSIINFALFIVLVYYSLPLFQNMFFVLFLVLSIILFIYYYRKHINRVKEIKRIYKDKKNAKIKIQEIQILNLLISIIIIVTLIAFLTKSSYDYLDFILFK